MKTEPQPEEPESMSHNDIEPDLDLANLQRQKQAILSAQNLLTPSEIESLRHRSQAKNKALMEKLKSR